jgi:hypothetical protein
MGRPFVAESVPVTGAYVAFCDEVWDHLTRLQGLLIDESTAEPLVVAKRYWIVLVGPTP